MSTISLRISFLASALAFTFPAHATGTATHAMVVAGQAFGGVGPFGCATSGPQARESGFFNTGVGLPTEGYASCHLAGGIANDSHTFGPSFSDEAVTSAFNGGSATLSAKARADFGSLGVASDGAYTGTTDGFTYHGAEGAAYFTDSLTISGTGTYFMRMGFSVDGSAITAGSSQTLTYLNYQVGAGPIFSAFVAGAGGGSDRAVNPTGTGSGITMPGFTVAPDSVSGSGVAYSFLTPITAGTAFDLTVGFYAASYPHTLADNDWFSTAMLSSIQLFDGSGNPVAFSITSASGTLYDANGAHPAVSGVPEPVSWSMMLGGFGLVGASMRTRRRAVTCLT